MQSTDIIQPLPLISPIATEGLKNSIPDAATGTNNASIEEGFPEITMQAPANGGLPPFGQDFNGLFYTVSSLNCFLQNGGYITFSQAVSDKIGGYPSGAILDYIDSTGSYSKVQSLIDNNTNNFVTTPSFIDGVNWKQLEVSTSALATLANVDLSNISETGQKVIDGQWVSIEGVILSTITTGTSTVDLSENLPNDNNNYEIMLTCALDAANSVTAFISSEILPNKVRVAAPYPDQQRSINTVNFPIGQNRELTVEISGTANSSNFTLYGYRRLGTNE